MKPCWWMFGFCAMVMSAGTGPVVGLQTGGPPSILPSAGGDRPAPGSRMGERLLEKVDAAWERWGEGFERRREPEVLRRHQQALRAKFLAAIGGLPERTPLRPRVTGVLRRQGYRVEKVSFESRPDFHVTGALFMPESAAVTAPYPGVLVPCGHSRAATAHDEYQSMGALLALNGMVALVFDPIDQGERMQMLKSDGEVRYWGTRAHTLADIQVIPLGQSVARTMIWDSMRAVDQTGLAGTGLEPRFAGLLGIYFGNPKFRDAQGIEFLEVVDVAWQRERDNRGGDWSEQWLGFMAPDHAGRIELALECTEEAALWLDGRSVAKVRRGEGRAAGAVEAGAGETMSLELHYIQPPDERRPHNYTSTLRLLWRDPAGNWEPVPAGWLRHSMAQERELQRALRE